MKNTKPMAVRHKALDHAAKCVPTNWTDPLLTGEKAVIGPPPWSVPDIEKLFLAVRDRILALK